MEVNEHFSSKAKQDIILVEQALQGSQKAYTELLDRYRDTIYFMLLKMVKNKNDAEDLTIEAFGKAFKNLEQYTSDFAFSTWYSE
ncbi:MAG TPA: sigma factor [Bacteroidales bacterium]|nr:sigma factor [Bacteroidales bacterium]